MNIFVAKLAPTSTAMDLEDLFSQFGEIENAKVIMDRETGRSKCFGFVEMSDDDGVKAIEQLDGAELDGSTIVVKKSEQKENNGNDRRGGGGFNRGGGGYNRERSNDRGSRGSYNRERSNDRY